MRLLPRVALMATALAWPAFGAEPIFDVREIASPGRTAAAQFADLDGDGRTDLFTVGLMGLPPEEIRELRVYYQRSDGSLPETPDWGGTVLAGAGAYDVADLADGPGEEILLLLRDRVAVLAFAGRKATRREMLLPGAVTAAAAPDERGLDRLRIAHTDLSDGVRLLVPAIGECILLEPDGTIVARLDVGGRANYFIPPRPGPLIGENELELYFDFPRTDVADVDGDGRPDVVASSRHEIRVFLQREDGGFPAQPSKSLPIRRLDERDHIRSSGMVRTLAQDLDGDGLADLVITHTGGGLLDAHTETTFHLNREGSWDLSRSDRTFVVEGGWTAFQIVDLDGDGSLEFVQARVPLSILELVEILITRSIDVQVTVHRADATGLFAEKPSSRSKYDIEFRLETFEPNGFVPTIDGDVNGDGRLDRLMSGGGKAVEVHLGQGEGKKPFGRRSARQEMDTGGALRFGDLNNDALVDFVLYDRTRPDTPVRIGINRGVLPGTGPRPVLVAPAQVTLPEPPVVGE